MPFDTAVISMSTESLSALYRHAYSEPTLRSFTLPCSTAMLPRRRRNVSMYSTNDANADANIYSVLYKRKVRHCEGRDGPKSIRARCAQRGTGQRSSTSSRRCRLRRHDISAWREARADGTRTIRPSARLLERGGAEDDEDADEEPAANKRDVQDPVLGLPAEEEEAECVDREHLWALVSTYPARAAAGELPASCMPDPVSAGTCGYAVVYAPHRDGKVARIFDGTLGHGMSAAAGGGTGNSIPWALQNPLSEIPPSDTHRMLMSAPTPAEIDYGIQPGGTQTSGARTLHDVGKEQRREVRDRKSVV